MSSQSCVVKKTKHRKKYIVITYSNTEHCSNIIIINRLNVTATVQTEYMKYHTSPETQF